MLSLIGEYIALQEKYVTVKLRNNKQLLKLAKESWMREDRYKQ